MSCPGYTDVLDLTAGESLDLIDAAGATLRVTRGRLWLTMEHDPRDVVIEPGDTFTIDRPGLTIAQAQAATTLCLIRRGRVERRAARPRRGAFDRFVDALARLGVATRRRTVAYY